MKETNDDRYHHHPSPSDVERSTPVQRPPSHAGTGVIDVLLADDHSAAFGAGERVFPALVPDPFGELADRVDAEDRRIVAMLLLRASPDEIARLLGISARSFRKRRGAIVRHLDAPVRARSAPAGWRSG